ncbi:hypothetical protein ACOMHN_027866 [Nucella lapillus]
MAALHYMAALRSTFDIISKIMSNVDRAAAITTVWEKPGMQMTFPNLKTGVAREEKTSPSFTTGQPCWN